MKPFIRKFMLLTVLCCITQLSSAEVPTKEKSIRIDTGNLLSVSKTKWNQNKGRSSVWLPLKLSTNDIMADSAGLFIDYGDDYFNPPVVENSLVWISRNENTDCAPVQVSFSFYGLEKYAIKSLRTRIGYNKCNGITLNLKADNDVLSKTVIDRKASQSSTYYTLDASSRSEITNTFVIDITDIKPTLVDGFIPYAEISFSPTFTFEVYDVEPPVINGGRFMASNGYEITSATEGAVIRYSVDSDCDLLTEGSVLDGKAPSLTSGIYTVRAIAVHPDEESGKPVPHVISMQDLYITDSGSVGAYDVDDVDRISILNEDIEIPELLLTENEVDITGKEIAFDNCNVSLTFGEGAILKKQADGRYGVSLPEGCAIKATIYNAANPLRQLHFAGDMAMEYLPQTSGQSLRAADNSHFDTGHNLFHNYGNAARVFVTTAPSVLTGIETSNSSIPTSIDIVNESKPEVAPTYYNLQGGRISEPSLPGLYIKVANGVSQKILIK